YQRPTFSSSAIAHTVQELGGWSAFCDCKEQDVAILRGKFFHVYAERVQRGAATQQTGAGK
ncbi:MAG: hypothetical protein ACRDRT_10585, partial [Pseudonocardiaceae bacterium]